MTIRGLSWQWLPVVLLMLPHSARAQEPVDYVRQIKPVLQERCYACHGVLKQKGGLRLDTAAFAIKGGKGGPAITPSKADESTLIERVTSHDESDRMPPEGEPLTPAQIKLLQTWITEGAKAPADEQAERDPRDHWAFKTPVRPAVPKVPDAQWNRNPIDAFIAADHQRQGLKHQPPSDKRLWLRRVYLDLIGLPPTPAEMQSFLADQSPQAIETVVDRLLASPQYGERWGRHWMDIWRYSDWWGLGAEVRNSQKHIWRWRDWIIESLNADKGYDQMLREMLAADEMYPNDLNRLRATGYLARQYFKFNRTSWLDETIEHTSKAMLGMTFNCSKCHDHKYDPLSQVEYYQLRAIFEPYQVRTDFVPGEMDIERDGLPRVFDCNLEAKTFLHIRGDDRNPDKSAELKPSIPAFLNQAEWKLAPVTLPAEAYQPGLRSHVIDDHVRSAEQQIATARTALIDAQKKLADIAKAPKPQPTPPALAKDAAPVVKDDFANERPELWQRKAGEWKHANGKLIQSQDGANRGVLQLKKPLPENFEARLRFQTTGGQMWKSVGITFDVNDPAEVLAYASAYASGSKTQIAYKAGAEYTYPTDAVQLRKIELNKPYEMTLRVRGTLVNLLIDGQLSIAYRLPVARKRGDLQIITFDAKAEFSNFELRELADDVTLASPKSAPSAATEPLTEAQAKLRVAIAEKSLATAEAHLLAIRARAAAMSARYQPTTKVDATTLAREAVKHERTLALRRAEEAALQAEFAVMQAAADKKAETEQKRKAALAAVETARKAIETIDDKFTPIPGAIKTLESNNESEDSRRKPFPTTSTGRRTGFAKWLTDSRHPLPARVAVNHIWMRHMGKPLVPTVFDFGRKGTPPTHPDLLDWLAVELIENGWSMKHLHRLIVTSETYRMSSSSVNAAPENLTRDRDNRYYWRGNPIRMEAQIVRDSLLHMAGDLDPTVGGPSIPVSNETSRRRSLYFVHSHNEHQKFLSIFDDASVLDCYRRAESVVPQQALALENSQLVSTMAVKIAQRIAAQSSDSTDRAFVDQAFLTVLATVPSADERAIAIEALTLFTDSAKRNQRPNPQDHARTALIQALLNHNDFITVR